MTFKDISVLIVAMSFTAGTISFFYEQYRIPFLIKDEIDKCQLKYSELERENKEKKKKIDDLTKFNGSSQTQIKSSMTSINQLTTKIKALEAQYGQLKAENSKISSWNQQLSDNKTLLQNQLKICQENSNFQNKISQLEQVRTENYKKLNNEYPHLSYHLTEVRKENLIEENSDINEQIKGYQQKLLCQ